MSAPGSLFQYVWEESSLLAGAHIRFGQPDPNEGFPAGTQFRAPLLLANVSDNPVNAHVSVDYTLQDKEETNTSQSAKSKTQPDTPADKVNNIAVKDLTIAPRDVQKIELSDEMTRFPLQKLAWRSPLMRHPVR